MVNKYNIKKFVEEAYPDKFTTFREHEIVVMVGPKGVIVTDNEAVHEVFKSTDEKYEIQVVTPTTDANTIKLFPDASGMISIKELMKANVEQVELTEYVRKFGSRIERNYATLLKSIKEIGLNPNDYPRK